LFTKILVVAKKVVTKIILGSMRVFQVSYFLVNSLMERNFNIPIYSLLVVVF